MPRSPTGKGLGFSSVGARCTVAVRPTLIALDAQPGGPGRVVRSVFQGTSTIHLVEVAGTQVTLESLSEERHATGAAVGVRPLPGVVCGLTALPEASVTGLPEPDNGASLGGGVIPWLGRPVQFQSGCQSWF